MAALPQAKSMQEHLLAITNGNTTWSLPRDQQLALAAANFKNEQEIQKGGIDTLSKVLPADIGGRSGIVQNAYNADQTRAGVTDKGIADIEVARIGADGREKSAVASHAADQGKTLLKQQEEDQKRVTSVLAGSNIAPSKEAIKRYGEYEKAATDWDKQAQTDLGVIRKTQPELAAAYLPLVAEYHKTKDPEAQAKIKASIDKLLGPQRVAMPVFTRLLSPPQFNTSGLLPHKQDTTLTAGL
jgi:hypothetical protein